MTQSEVLEARRIELVRILRTDLQPRRIELDHMEFWDLMNELLEMTQNHITEDMEETGKVGVDVQSRIHSDYDSAGSIVNTTPQMTCFRGATVCTKWHQEKVTIKSYSLTTSWNWEQVTS